MLKARKASYTAALNFIYSPCPSARTPAKEAQVERSYSLHFQT
ncbi:hypothetical protein P5792_08150 [Bacillus toyonensis]|nr:hypothetical protein [Bacillus toyonensis]